jgi:hypothetical protein
MRWLFLAIAIGGCSDELDITRNRHDLSVAQFNFDMNSLPRSGDGGNPEGDGGGLDPAFCPMGVADGCCPLLRYGGSDPDCKALTCTLQPSAPIALEDHTRSGERRGMVALAWNGSELALARTDIITVNNMAAEEIVFERRDFAGNSSFAPQRTRASTATSPGHTSLAFEPQSQSYLYLDSASLKFQSTGLSNDGQMLWNDSNTYEICNGVDAIGDAFAQGGRFIVAGDQFTCAGSTSQPILVEFAANGTKGTTTLIGDGMHPELSWHGSQGCDLDCQHLLSIWDRQTEGSLRGRVLTTATEKVDTGFDLEPVSGSYVDHSGIASDGNLYFVYRATQSGTGTAQSFRRFQVGTGYVDSGFTTSGPRALPPSVIWTGSGYLVAAATFMLTTSLAFPNDNHAYSIQLWQFDAQGKFVATWQNETDAGYEPQLAWAGGRIALSWVRVPATGDEQRFLRYLDCP